MAEGVVQYPEPLTEPSPAGQSAVGGGATDELLSQLAGQEIDRLLAEADVERPGAEPEAKLPSAESAPAVADAIIAKDAAVDPADAPADSSSASVTTTASEPTDPAPAIEKLLPDLDAPRAEQAIADLVGPIDPELDEATREFPSDERAGLDLALGPAAAQLDVEDAEDADAQSQLLVEGARPWYLRPLDRLDECFAAFPEGVLEILGKIAILTTVNAIAVLAYVLFFRHH
jgi:hypothetical protein